MATESYPVKRAAHSTYVADLDGADTYVSMGCFWGWSRRIDTLKHIGAVWTDLDYHILRAWRDKPVEQVFEALKFALKDRGIPFPSWVMATGRGTCLVWLHTFIPKAALPRWTSIQKHLAKALADFGADKNAIDRARVFRLAGSRNSKARGNSLVRALYVSGDPETLRSRAWDFETLALELLPVERTQLHSLVAERARRHVQKIGDVPRKPAIKLSWASYGEAILTDLHRLRYLRYGDGQLPAGHRDEWLFIASCALAHGCPSEALKREIVSMAADVSGWSAREALSNMGAVIRRAVCAAKGKRYWGQMEAIMIRAINCAQRRSLIGFRSLGSK